MLSQITRERHAAGQPSPSHGLEQFINVSNGATFNGAHRARVDARTAGDVLVPHPGYNKADYNRLTRAMTADIRDMAAAATKGTGGKPATAAQQRVHRPRFRSEAEKRIRAARRKQNKGLNRLLGSQGQAPLEKLMGAASEKGGNLKLLAQLRAAMSPSEFQVIGGQLLHELGHNNATGEFSLSKFATGFDKLSDGAKSILFSPTHLKNIEDIAGLGSHIKKALRDTKHVPHVQCDHPLRVGQRCRHNGVHGRPNCGLQRSRACRHPRRPLHRRSVLALAGKPRHRIIDGRVVSRQGRHAFPAIPSPGSSRWPPFNIAQQEPRKTTWASSQKKASRGVLRRPARSRAEGTISQAVNFQSHDRLKTAKLHPNR